MSPSPSPVVANWELVVRLRERRLERRLSVMEFARRLNFTHNYWSQIENERKVVSAGTLEKIFDVLALDDTDRGLLRQLREQAKENGWWSEYNDLFDEAIQRFYGLEHGAQRISEHETLLIPGLLQTKDYARAVMSSFATFGSVEVEQRVAARLRRQELLRGDNPLRLMVIISEAVLRQASRRSRRASRPTRPSSGRDRRNTRTTSKSAHYPSPQPQETSSAPAHSAFWISTAPAYPGSLWHETVTIWGIINDANKVRDITVAFKETLARTLDRWDTKKMIETHRKELH